MSITITQNWEVEGSLTDVTSAKLSDPTGTYGVKRNDTDAVVVADGTDMTHVGTGQYSYTFDEPEPGLSYTAYVEIVYQGNTYWFEKNFTGTQESAEGGSTDTLNIYEPIFPTLYGEDLRYKLRAVKIDNGIDGYLKIKLLDNSGTEINLDELKRMTGSGGGFSEISVTSPTFKVKFHEAATESFVDEITAYRVNGESDTIICALPDDVKSKPAVYIANIGILDSDTVIHINRCYLYNQASAWSSSMSSGPPALEEIRLAISDADPLMAELLDEYQFDLPEVCYAVTETVRFWNNYPPPIYSKSTATFPWRYIWLKGIQAFLFMIIEEFHRKNELRYSAGAGLTQEDRGKERNYKIASAEKYQEFVQLVARHKARLNMTRGFGYFLSDYYR